MDKFILKIKVLFLLLCVLIVLSVWGGSIILKRSEHAKLDYLTKYLSYLKYKIEYQGFNPLFAETTSASFTPKIYSASNDKSESIPIIFYGNINNKNNAITENEILNSLKNQMFALKKAGYETINSNELYKFTHGEIGLPPKSFVLTFEDQNNKNYEFASPILKAIGYDTIIFTEYDPTAKNKNQTEQLLNSGKWEIKTSPDSEKYGPYLMAPLSEEYLLMHKSWLRDKNRLETNEEFDQRIKNNTEQTKITLMENLGIDASLFISANQN
jgi:hypothetical protein